MKSPKQITLPVGENSQKEDTQLQKRYDLHTLTKGKTLLLYDKKQRFTYYFRLNKTLYNLAMMHCQNEGIDHHFFMESVILDYFKRNKITNLGRVAIKKAEINHEERIRRRKRLASLKQALKEMRGIRTIIGKHKPKKKRTVLEIKSRRDYDKEGES